MAFAMQCCSDVDSVEDGLCTHFANDLSASVCTRFSSCCACSCCRICSLTAFCSAAEVVGTDMRGGVTVADGCARCVSEGDGADHHLERGRADMDCGVALGEFRGITAVNCGAYS